MVIFPAKKYLGQHFLQDKALAQKIVNSLSNKHHTLIEVGPGTGILTELLVQQENLNLYLVEVDTDLANYLRKIYPQLENRIITANFLTFPCDQLGNQSMAIIGNFPYNISSQLFFKILTHRQQIHEVVGMVQKEVAERLIANPKTKAYGMLSVFLQAFYDLEYLCTVEPTVFRPPPKVHSAVIRLCRNTRPQLRCDEATFFHIVRAGFQQRRKTLRNALKSRLPVNKRSSPLLSQRAEALTVADFVALTNYITQ